MIQPSVYKIDGAALDRALAIGHYRLGCVVFTTAEVEQADSLYPVHWLRYAIANFKSHKGAQELIKRNKNFKVIFEPLLLNDEIEVLYKKYKNGLSFDISNSLQENLFDFSNYNTNLFLFDSNVIKVYDGDLLIAAGVFDKGEDSIAGIINIYDPAYKKYSLGKNLMLQKMLWAQAQGKRFYYPGYVIENNTKFDYKFFLGKACCELFEPEKNIWYPASEAACFNHIL